MLNHVAPAVATMSLGVPVGQWSRALDSAVSSLINQAKAGAPRLVPALVLLYAHHPASQPPALQAGAARVQLWKQQLALLFTIWILAGVKAQERGVLMCRVCDARRSQW